MSALPLVDAHLDLAENVTLFGRDLTLPVAQIRASEKHTGAQATVSLPALEEGDIAVVVATVTAGFLAADVGEDFELQSALYRTPEEAEAQALAQIDLYETWERQGRVRLLKSVADLEHHLPLWRDDGKPGLVLLMEGADPIVRAGGSAACGSSASPSATRATAAASAAATGSQHRAASPRPASPCSSRWPQSVSSGTSPTSPKKACGSGLCGDLFSRPARAGGGKAKPRGCSSYP